MKKYTPYFIYNGIDSREMGVIITSMPPVIRAEKRVDTITIPGRSGSLHFYDGAFENYTKTMECAIVKRERINEIAAWLVGCGNIIFSTEPDKFYKVHMINQISIEQMMHTFQKFQVNMDTYPFKYSVNQFDEEITITEPKTILNIGTIFSEPVIKIYGTGQVTLYLNGENFEIKNMDGYVTINSEIMEVYREDVSQNNVYLADDFPKFAAGENTLNWSGNVQKIEIKPNWRWL